MTIQMIRTDDGEDKVVLSIDDYQDLVDARDHAATMRGIANGTIETLSDADLDAYLAAPSPLAFWRNRRGLTQEALASNAGISQAYLAQVETGKRVGAIRLYARLAKLLRLQMEDLVPDDD